jgi:hypothetical protein
MNQSSFSAHVPAVAEPPQFGVELLLGEAARLLYCPEPLERHVAVHGASERLGELTSIPALSSGRAAIVAWDGLFRTARAWAPASGKSFELFATREQLPTLYDACFNILLENAERFIPELTPLCRKLEADLRLPAGRVNVQLFCAAAGGRAAPHFDSSFTFNCQLRGTKTWRLARNEFLRFPPRHVGGFLGRRPGPELDLALLSAPIPVQLQEAETFVAAPGSVVFLPPGVLHETQIESESLAVAFAIEETDSIADRTSALVERELRRDPALRAARLGAQFIDTVAERQRAAATLRRIAAALELDAAPWSAGREQFRLHPSVSVALVGGTTIRVESAAGARSVSVDPVMAAVLGHAASRAPFLLSDVIAAPDEVEASALDACLRTLVGTGLLQRVA